MAPRRTRVRKRAILLKACFSVSKLREHVAIHPDSPAIKHLSDAVVLDNVIHILVAASGKIDKH